EGDGEEIRRPDRADAASLGRISSFARNGGILAGPPQPLARPAALPARRRWWMDRRTSRSVKKKPLSRKPSAVTSPHLLAAALGAQGERVFIAEVKETGSGVKILLVKASFCAMNGRTAAELVGKPHGVVPADKSQLGKRDTTLSSRHSKKPFTGEE